MPLQVVINTDGACAGNPGPGGFAAVIQIPGHPDITVVGADPATTNNRMELAAVIEAFHCLNTTAERQQLGVSAVTVRSDSQYIINAFNKGWISNWKRNGWRSYAKEPVKNRELWQELLQATAPYQIKWVWVRGHSGDRMNDRCDRLAAKEAKSARGAKGYWTKNDAPV